MRLRVIITLLVCALGLAFAPFSAMADPEVRGPAESGLLARGPALARPAILPDQPTLPRVASLSWSPVTGRPATGLLAPAGPHSPRSPPAF